MTRVFKVVQRLPDERLISATAKRWATVIEYRVGEWVQAPDWYGTMGEGLYCFRLEAKYLFHALTAASLTPGGEVWVAEGGEIRPVRRSEDSKMLKDADIFPPLSPVMTDRIRLIRRIGVEKVKGYVVARVQDGKFVDVLCGHSKADVDCWGIPWDPCLHLVFPKRRDAEEQARRNQGAVFHAMAYGVLLEPFRSWAPGGGFSKLTCGWPAGAVQALRVGHFFPAK